MNVNIEIPIKKTTSISSNLPDIRVSVSYNAIIKPDITEHILGIKISNQDKDTVFLKYPKISLKNRIEHIPIFHDDVFGKSISEIGRLEPGNSFEIYSNPNNYIDLLNELDNIIVEDKIGRIFKGNPDELKMSIDSWNKSQQEHKHNAPSYMKAYVEDREKKRNNILRSLK